MNGLIQDIKNTLAEALMAISKYLENQAKRLNPAAALDLLQTSAPVDLTPVRDGKDVKVEATISTTCIDCTFEINRGEDVRWLPGKGCTHEQCYQQSLVNMEPYDVGTLFQYDGEEYRLDDEQGQWYYRDLDEDTETPVGLMVVPDPIVNTARSHDLI